MTSKERPLIVYYSGTGQTNRLVNKINPSNSFETVRIKTGKEVITREYILITPTYMKGEVPKPVQKLLSINHPPKEVIGTGNRQWGQYFCGAGETIAKAFNIPLIAKIEQSGHFNEVANVLSYFKDKYKVVGG